MIYLKNKDKKVYFQDKDIGILIYNSKIKEVILYEFKNEKYLSEFNLKEILKINDIEEKYIFKEIYKILKIEVLKERAETPLNKEISLFCGINSNEIEHFSEEESFLKFFGVEKTQKITLKIDKILSTKEDITNEEIKNEEDNIFYGFWDIKENEISSTFIFKSLIQTKMCFPDFGDNSLKEGSQFVKLRNIS